MVPREVVAVSMKLSVVANGAECRSPRRMIASRSEIDSVAGWHLHYDGVSESVKVDISYSATFPWCRRRRIVQGELLGGRLEYNTAYQREVAVGRSRRMHLDDMCIDVYCTRRAPSFRLTMDEGARVVGPSLLEGMAAGKNDDVS